MGDVEVVENADGTVDYNLTMRDDIKFSDGTPADIDDVIFGIYVMADPTYDGASTIYALPIEGMSEYYNSLAQLSTLLVQAGKDNTDFTNWDEETQTQFWADVETAGEAFAQEIVDYCMANGLGTTVAECAANWGYPDLPADATALDFWHAIEAAYEGDIIAASDTETAGSSLFDFIDGYDEKYGQWITMGDSVDYITGIIRTGDYSMTVHMTSYDATAIYNMGFYIAPLHYYGDEASYNYDEHKFGFPKGDLSIVREKTTQPLGCGPYVFEGYNNGVATLTANPYYFQGEPATKTLLMQEADDADFIPGVVTGSFDIAVPSLNDDAVAALESANSNGEMSGDVVDTELVDYRGYGYVGINANLVSVGGVAGSQESKDLRLGLMTLLSVYRDTVINSYYGEIASVIQYPISNTSWAAPRPTDEGYQNCYSTDVDGNPIYTEGMSDEQKYDAALQAAIGFFKAAGYTWDEATSTFTAAPEGASMSYEVMIPGMGQQDHPAYGVAVAASEALKTIGIDLVVNDVGNETWNNALEGNTAQIWAAAWQSTPDPDMYQVYHSRNANGQNTNSNHYQIVDETLDELILDARASSDNAYRKATYKECLEIILSWGVELPLYQRKDCSVFSAERVDLNTIPQDMTPYWGWYAEIETMATAAVQ